MTTGRALKLAALPAAISAAVTLLRLTGERRGWSAAWFSPATGGLHPHGWSWLIGITWLPLVFGPWFAWRLWREGDRPRGATRSTALAVAGLVGAVLALRLLVPLLPLPFPPILLVIWLVMAVAAALQVRGWPSLFRTLLCYGLLSRAVVVIVMGLAMRGGWGTHYDYVGMPEPFQMPLVRRFLWLAVFPQLVFWTAFTVVLGSLAGGLAAVALERFPRGRGARRVQRALRLRLAVIRYVLRRLGPPLLGAAAYTLVAAWIYWWDVRRTGGQRDYGGAVYAIYTQLFFEPTEQLPPGLLGRAVLWITPLAGVFLIAEGLLKVGASLFDLAARREVWVKLMSEQMRGHVVVCGLGQVGYRVVQELRALGEDVVCVELAAKDSFLDEVQAMGVPVHLGDARHDEVLRAAGIERARAVICATGDDLANLEMALDVKRMSPGTRVLMRMFDQRLAAKVGGVLALDQSFSTSALAAPLVALQATQPEVLSAYRLGSITRVTAALPVGAGGAGLTVAEVEADGGCRVVACNAGPRAPSAQHELSAGDRLVVDVPVGGLAGLRERLGSARG